MLHTPYLNNGTCIIPLEKVNGSYVVDTIFHQPSFFDNTRELIFNRKRKSSKTETEMVQRHDEKYDLEICAVIGG
ncbi:MAG: hypothetical protein FWD05_07480 [Oscillospiraceae bacterium]|nr:hypothetical protein [Oscillospiraceae bacterium]